MSILKRTVAIVTGILLSFTLFTSTVFAADYRVVQNDSLYKISTLFKTPVSTLMSDNNLSTSSIYPGQVLNVSAAVYTVKNGDSLFLIAQRFGISLTSIRQANNKWDNMIITGQQLILPGIKPGSSAVTQQTVIPYTAAEVNLLARLITAETTGEPYDAMVGVGAVVVNRVQSPDWPSSINSVINQVINGYYQFTPVKNGQINNPPSDMAIKAAWAALYGNDPSNEAQFYYDNTTTNQWMLSKPITARIGSMIFVK